MRAVRQAVKGYELNIGPGIASPISLSIVCPRTGYNIRVTAQVNRSIKPYAAYQAILPVVGTGLDRQGPCDGIMYIGGIMYMYIGGIMDLHDDRVFDRVIDNLFGALGK